jgi:hypothetical protein
MAVLIPAERKALLFVAALVVLGGRRARGRRGRGGAPLPAGDPAALDAQLAAVDRALAAGDARRDGARARGAPPGWPAA